MLWLCDGSGEIAGSPAGWEPEDSVVSLGVRICWTDGLLAASEEAHKLGWGWPLKFPCLLGDPDQFGHPLCHVCSQEFGAGEC